MRVADRRGDAAREVAPPKAVGPRAAPHGVLDDRDALQLHVAVGHVQSAAAPVPHGEQERRQARRRLGEVARDRRVGDAQGVALADAAAVRIDAAAVGEQPADGVAAHRRPIDRGQRPRVAGASDRIHAATGRAAAERGIPAHRAALHLDDVGIDRSAEGPAVARRVEVTLDVVVVEPAILQPGDSPDGHGTATRERPRLIVGIHDREPLRHAAAAGDVHVDEGEIALDRQHACRRTAGPGERDSRREVGRVDHDVLPRDQCRAAVVAVEPADEVGDRAARLVPDTHHLALEPGVLVRDDRQGHRAAVEAAVEANGLPRRGGRQRGPQRHRAGRGGGRVEQAVDDDRVAARGRRVVTTAAGTGGDQGEGRGGGQPQEASHACTPRMGCWLHATGRCGGWRPWKPRTPAPSRNQDAGLSRAASALITWNSWSSPPAMPASVTYLPLTTTVGVLVMR